MNESQRKKRSFRQSQKWKSFRHQKNVEQRGIDPITLRKLQKGANLHHRNLQESEYENLSNEEDFVLLNINTHKFLHWVYTYWKSDPDILVRIENELSKWH